MSIKEVLIHTNGERYYDITQDIRAQASGLIKEKSSGVLHLFVKHTSCALCISEAYEDSAKKDCENFMKHIAPRNLEFITHTTEGEDDSPSHMKSMILHQSISFIVENGEIILGQWQGIYLTEFRDAPHARKVLLKFQAD